MLRYGVAILILLGGLVVGCAETVSFDQLMRVQSEDWAETINSWWYTGSDGQYHYFHNSREMFSRDLRVPSGDMLVKREFDRTRDRKQWVRVPLGNFKENDPRLELDFFPDKPHLSQLYKMQ